MTAYIRPPKSKIVNAWMLAVVSDSSQEDTIPHQISWAEGVCAAEGWRLTNVIQGVSSGKDGPRAKVRELVLQLRALREDERPGYVLAIRLDRIGRGSIVDSQVILKEITDLKVKVRTREEGTVEVDNAMGELIAAVRFVAAAQENAVRIDKANAVYARKRERQKLDPRIYVGPRPPYGLCLDSESRLIPIEPQAGVVRRIFALRVEGLGHHLISKRIAPNAPPIERKGGKREAYKWTASSVARTISNKAYKNSGLITPEIWESSQTEASIRLRRPQVHEWSLTGALRCASDNTPLMGLTNSSGRRWYACRRHNGRFKCHSYELVEAQFLAVLEQLSASPRLIERALSRADDASEKAELLLALESRRRELIELEKRREKIWTAVESGAFRPETAQERLDELAERRESLSQAAEILENKVAVVISRQFTIADASKIVQRAATVWRSAELVERKQLASLVSKALGGLRVDEQGQLILARDAFDDICLEPKPLTG